MVSLLAVLMVFQGKANLRNLSRYCALHEKSLSGGYRRSFDFVAFNGELPSDTAYIAAIDLLSFLRKSGNTPKGWGWYYHSQSDRVNTLATSICRPTWNALTLTERWTTGCRSIVRWSGSGPSNGRSRWCYCAGGRPATWVTRCCFPPI